EASAIAGNLERGSFVILVEGLENLGAVPDTERLVTAIANLSLRYPALSILVFCDSRTLVAPIPGFTVCELARYSAEQEKQYATAYFDTPLQAQAFLKDLVAHPRLRQLASNPLLLSLMCFIFIDTKTLPGETSAFYDNVIETIMSDSRGVAPT